MYKVSILTPVYNVERFFEKCTRSLFEQTYSNLEYIFVNDCTPDRSIDILNNVLEDYPNRKGQVKLITNEKNRGASASKNIAIDNATGEFVSFVDADDWMELNAVELLVTEQLRTGSDVVWGKFVEHTNDGNYPLQEPSYKNKQEWLLCYCRLTTGSIMANWRRIIRRSLLEQHNIRSVEGFNYAEDKLLMCQVAYYANNFSTIDDYIYHYNRLNALSVTAKQSNTFNINAFQQEIGSIQCIEDFFSTKESVYYYEVERAKVRYLKEKLGETIRYSSRAGFKEVVKKINRSNPDFLNEIGWSPWKRLFQENYYCMKYFPKIVRRAKWLIEKA